MKAIKTTAAIPCWLDEKEQLTLLRAIEKDLQLSKLRSLKRWAIHRRDASLTIFMLHTGLRLNECTKLHLNDVTLTKHKGTVMVQNGKCNRQRIVPLNVHAREAVEAWLKVRPEGRRSRDRRGDEYLWVELKTKETSGLSIRSMQRILNRYAQEAGLENLSPSILHRSFAKNLVNSGVSLEKVALLLGTTNLNATRIYTTPDSRDLELAVEQLEDVVQQDATP